MGCRVYYIVLAITAAMTIAVRMSSTRPETLNMHNRIHPDLMSLLIAVMKNATMPIRVRATVNMVLSLLVGRLLCILAYVKYVCF